MNLNADPSTAGKRALLSIQHLPLWTQKTNAPYLFCYPNPHLLEGESRKQSSHDIYIVLAFG